MQAMRAWQAPRGCDRRIFKGLSPAGRSRACARTNFSRTNSPRAASSPTAQSQLLFSPPSTSRARARHSEPELLATRRPRPQGACCVWRAHNMPRALRRMSSSRGAKHSRVDVFRTPPGRGGGATLTIKRAPPCAAAWRRLLRLLAPRRIGGRIGGRIRISRWIGQRWPAAE